MHAFLIIGEGEDYIKKIKERKIDFPLKKIADVRELGNFTKLKQGKKTAIIIKDMDSATEEAQSAFLKSLEEPQENLTFILTAGSIQNILPTIISRCEIIEIPNSKLQIPNSTKNQIIKFINSDTGQKLKTISAITKREEAIELMKNLILVGHEAMLENPNIKYLITNENAIKTLQNLEANGNIPLQLTNFVINIS